MDESTALPFADPAAVFGSIDVYLFDQLLKGRLRPRMRVLDAGCGGGRNLDYLLRAGFDLRGCDASEEAVASVRERARALAPAGGPVAAEVEERFTVARLEDLALPPASQDAVLCNAVLHFAQHDAHFAAMLEGVWRVLAPGGLFFARLASAEGLEGALVPRGDGRFLLPDGSERYLVDTPTILAWTGRLGAELVDPVKTTNVQGLRCMATWVLRRPAG